MSHSYHKVVDISGFKLKHASVDGLQTSLVDCVYVTASECGLALAQVYPPALAACFWCRTAAAV